MSFIPYAVSWNITSKCNLECGHCYIDAGARADGLEGELDTQKAFETIDEIACVNPGAVLILTGGEPLMRSDIFDICKKASSKGLMVVVGTNGTLLTQERATALKTAGVAGVGVSIDSLYPQSHDKFRGRDGSYKDAIDGLKNARNAGLEIQFQTTPTDSNLDEIPKIAELAHSFGAKVFNIFFLVCTGRGQKMSDISPESYEKVLLWAAENQSAFPGMMLRPKCAPHFKRILHQKDSQHPLLSTYIAACRAGTHYCRIDPHGKVTPCAYMPLECGDLNKNSFDDIWNNSEEFVRYRNPSYGGKCGECGYRLLCGGCRARAYAETGDDMDEDRWCVYEPVGHEEAIVNSDTVSKFGDTAPNAHSSLDGARWDAEAKVTLEKIPVFARTIVESACNDYALKNGIDLITRDIMKTAAPRPDGNPFAQKKESVPIKTEQGQIPWDGEASDRAKNAPEFVTPGVLKLMQIRARQRSKKVIDSEFLTEIRNESMMLVTRRMKKIGVDALGMEAWGKALDKFGSKSEKAETINEIVDFLNDRSSPNEAILAKFKSFFADDSQKMGWTEEARTILDRTPTMMRSIAKEAVEKHAKKSGYKYVTETAIKEATENIPFGNFRQS